MTAIAYSVIASLPDERTASEYIAWLESGHVDHVVACGAHTGMIVRVQEPAEPVQVETRYIFPNRAAFETYVREHAPKLRAEGLRRFGPERGVRFERRVGTVV
jgi:hypothetical protein